MKKKDAVKTHEELRARVEKTKGAIDPIYMELGARLGGRNPENMARIMQKLATPEQAKLVSALPDTDRDPKLGRSLEVSDAFAKKLGMSKTTVDKHIRELYEKGLLFPTRGGPSMARTFLQLHDAALGNPKYEKALGKEYYDLWGVMDGPMREPAPENLIPRFSAFRVVPRWKSIKDVPGVLPCEDVRAILKAQDLIVLLECGCKKSHTDRWCEIPDESCITVGRTAQYNLDRGAGRKITYEEALEVIEKYDKLPVINAVVNQREVNQLVCNCHYCCCGAVRGAAKSRFEVVVNPEKCRACKICIDRCQYGAIEIKFDPALGRERTYVDVEKCRGCGCCVITCPGEARTMKVVRPPEHIPESGAIY